MSCPQDFNNGQVFAYRYKDWETDRWAPRKNSDADKNWPRWGLPFPQPRTCGYCGGVHPEDAAQLIAAGWTLEQTTKTYKHYMHPPGYLESMYGRPYTGPVYESPVPPVKLYGYHVSQEQADAINAAIKSR